MPAPCSRRSSRRASRRSAPAPCRAWRTISPPCSTIAIRSGPSSMPHQRKDAPLEEAVALLVRERLTGEPPPQHAGAGRAVAAVDRGEGRRPSRSSASTPCTIRRPSPACRATSSPPSTWPMSSARTPTSAKSSDEERSRTRFRRAQRDAARARSRRQQPGRGDAGGRGRDRRAVRDGRPAARHRRHADDMDSDEDARRRRAVAAAAVVSRRRTRISTASITNQFDEEIAAEDLCDSDELTRLRNYLDKQLSNLQGVVARLANRLQRRLMAQQNRSWDFDLEEGTARCRAPVAHRHRSAASALLQGRAGHAVPRHRGDAAARQFGLDARPARSPSPRPAPIFSPARSSAAASRSRSSASPPAPGRAASRARNGWPPASPPIPAASTILRHIIYKSADIALAARAAQSRPHDARGPAQGEHRRRSADLGA